MMPVLWIHNIINGKEAWDMEQVHNLLITNEHWTKITASIDDVKIVDS